MCGEHAVDRTFDIVNQGSSPHVRGALCQAKERRGLLGIIPACAGSTQLDMRAVFHVRDHPRMCGEHAKVPRVSRLQ